MKKLERVSRHRHCEDRTHLGLEKGRAEFDEAEEEITFSPIDVVSGSLQNNRSFCVGQSMRSSMTFKPHGIFMLLGSYHSQGLVTRVTANDDDYHRIGRL